MDIVVSNPIFSVILVNYNNSKDTILCLEHLVAQDFSNFEIIVVENGSEIDQIVKLENNIELIKKSLFAGTIKLLKMNKDLGFTGGNNRGIKESRGKLIYILNNDTIFPSNMLTSIYNYFNKTPRVDILTPKIMYYTNKDIIWALGGTFDFRNPLIVLINYAGEHDRDFPPVIRVNMVTGCAFVIRRKSLQKVGLFDDNYFMYWEDTDFSYRANKKGLKMVVKTDILVYHNVDEKQKLFSKFITGYLFRNRMYFFMKNGTKTQILIQLLLTPLYFGLHLINFKYRRFDGKILFKIKNIVDGFCLGLKSRLLKIKTH